MDPLANTVPWLLAAVLIGVCAGAAGVWVLVSRLRSLEALGARLESLEELKQALSRLVADREDLDLRRIEHVLIELRDGHRRLEDALLRAVQRAPGPGSGAAGLTGRPAGSTAGAPDIELSERVIHRLLALGYEEIRLVTRAEELARVAADGGEVLVEARRHGGICKGRVRVRDGALLDVDLQPAWSTFP